MNHSAISYTCIVANSAICYNCHYTMPSIASPGPLGPPPPLGNFNTRDEYTDILQVYAFGNMFSIAKSTYVPLKKAA
jgi:hypothetical protein